MKNRIYFFANFGDWNKVPYGGGEVGNRRTLDLFKRAKFDIVLIPKYLRVPNHSIKNICILLYRIIINILFFVKTLLLGRRRNSIVHIVGFYGPMIYLECFLISIAKFLRYKVVYEMRGGGADLYYEEGTVLYHKAFHKALHKADVIFTQGLENEPLIKRINTNIPIFYYPNYVMKDFYPSVYPSKPKDRINFIYFGRISPTKNVDIVVDTFFELCRLYKDIYLEIVGNCTDESYFIRLKEKIALSEYSSFVKILPACNHEQLKKYLSDKHFYIFPSKEPHEGHSNALTEAMSWGLIPIATSQGFNKSVIGNDSLIVNDLSVNDFVRCISYLLNKGVVHELSESMYNRILNNYTDDKVYEQLITEYNRLFERFFIKN